MTKENKEALTGERSFDRPWPGYESEADNNEYIVGWWDAELQAAHWFSLSQVAAHEAAMLLFQLDPRKGPNHRPWHVEGEPSPDDYLTTRRVFEDVALDGCPRTLRAWLKLADQKKLLRRSWVDQYLKAGGASETNQPPDPIGEVGQRPLQRQAAQQERVLSLLRQNGFDPKNLPERSRGRSGVKKQIKDIALRDKGLFSESSFKKAWDALRERREIVGAE